MDQLKFDPGLGTYSVNVAPESLWISKGMGAPYFQLQLEVGIPEIGEKAGQLLYLDTTVHAQQSNGPRVPLASTNVSVPFVPTGETRRHHLQYLITNAQLLALEHSRTGDLRLELQIRGFLPQASGFPGGPETTLHISVAESTWRQQLASLGRTLGVDMVIPFPADDEPSGAVTDFLREAQRLLGGRDIDSAMLQVRKALETIKTTSSWTWPGNKNKVDRTADERWSLIRSALEDQASGAMHGDAGTKDYTYTRAEVETLIGMTAALVRVIH
ncbi:MAG: hypothetical protein JWQ81_5926 [Amycolatopsis sp.]|uniref:hypothetical protein n=1 Tax=Amycolatopsis sp. TaxID=37632 RepID=UPI0026378B89|nr:hypothetical protein [Amycolatopsis sp.]MCU1685187.1 hypothetical protein [Amycolatopsis sp.]